MSDCIFCKILSGEIPSSKVYEDEKVLAFKDINPMAPVHILIIPKEHIEGVDMLTEENAPVVGHIMLVAKRLAEEYHLDNGYRIVSNVGEHGGQTVRHLHFHLLGGKKLNVELC
ncbi:MAG: histidine triad nucleotide-binding protein [Ruminiclostridium sp.]